MRQVRSSSNVNQNNYKEAFKLDINPRYISANPEKIAIADSEALFYTNNLDIVKKS